jgi:hypothetical protein
MDLPRAGPSFLGIIDIGNHSSVAIASIDCSAHFQLHFKMELWVHIP